MKGKQGLLILAGKLGRKSSMKDEPAEDKDADSEDYESDTDSEEILEDLADCLSLPEAKRDEFKTLMLQLKSC